MRKLNKINEVILASTYEVEMDLINDLDNHLNDRMIKMGYKPKASGYNSLDYHKAMKKLLLTHPRKVYYSKEFLCVDECRHGLVKLIADIESGKNLLPYMSKQVIKPKKNDGLLNDWNIHHFHLNIEYEENTIFIKRSDWLLLAFVNEEAVYCINVYPHKKPYLWSHIKLIEIIYNNWPDLIEKNRLRGVSALSEKKDDKSYSMLRKANATTFIELGENNVYGLIGGGYSSDGSSIEAVMTSDYWYNYIRKIEIYILDEYQSFKSQMLPFDSYSMEKRLEIKLLTITDEELILLEKQRSIIVKVNYNSGNIRMINTEGLMHEFLNSLKLYSSFKNDRSMLNNNIC